MQHTYHSSVAHADTRILLFFAGMSALLSVALVAVLHLSASAPSAQVGAFAAVPENEYNRITQQIAEKERELAIRESMVSSREAQLRDNFVARRDERTLVYASAAGFALLALILLNFALDARRASRARTVLRI